MNSETLPLLSICIPTYNRSKILEDSLVHITAEEIFNKTDDVEIIVADNASPDDTRAVCERFAAKFPSKFMYHRQEQNLGYSANMTTLMKLARGTFIKFLNDNFFFLPGKLENVCRVIKALQKDKPLLFFGSGHVPYCAQETFHFQSHDKMLDLLSYYTTWVGGFGFWQTDLPKVLETHEQYCETLIPQVAILWNLFDDKMQGVIDNRKLLSDKHSQDVTKGGYNVAEVFGKVYLGMLREHMKDGQISRHAYKKEKKRLFSDLIFFKYNDFLRAHAFIKGHYFANTVDFHRNLYYWISFLYWPAFKLASLLPKKLRYAIGNIYIKLRSLT